MEQEQAGTAVNVDDTVKSLISDEDDTPETEDTTNKGEIKDNLLTVKNKLQKKIRDKKLDEQKKDSTDQVLKSKRNKAVNKFVKFVTYPFRVNSYIGAIQNLEPLLFVLFVDALMLFFISALGYILYTVYTECDTYQKLIGCTVVAILCIFAQMHLNPTSPSKVNEGDTETDEEN